MHKLGYFRVKILINPIHDTQRLADFSRAYTKANNLIEYFHGDDYVKYVDMSFEESELLRELGVYKSSLTFDSLAMTKCKTVLGNYHHKTLKAMCNLSDYYLTLNQFEDALTLANEAYDTSQKIYGDEHPCTIYTIHSLTNVYRKMGRYNDALTKDLAAYSLCKKILVKSSVNEPLGTMKALADIADDYKGLKNYSSAIKYYEEILSKSSNIYDPEIARVRKKLAYLYNINGEYKKTVKLYDFLR